MQLESWPTARLVPYARNPRKNEGVADQMAASIREFGFKIPVPARSDGGTTLSAAEGAITAAI